MQTRQLGDVSVAPIGLGAMPFSTEPDPDLPRSIQTVHAALDAGVTLIDTADAYAPPDGPMGLNESIVADALRTYAGSVEGVLVATKGGHTREGGGWAVNGRPDYLRSACEASIRRLGVETIDLYQHHRPDPEVPYAETMGAMRELYDAGLVRRVGISNADPEQIRLAFSIVGDALVSVQNQFSPKFQSSAPEIDVCTELGLAFLPWSPLGGIGNAKELGSSYAAFQQVAEAHGVSAQQVCLAWELAQSDVVIPIPGASRPASIEDSVKAAELELSEDELAQLSAS